MFQALLEKNVLEEEPQKGELKDLCAGQELPNHLVLTAPLTEGLCGGSFDLSSMERGELCRDRCMGLLLADYMQDVGAAELNAKTLCAGLGLKSGV